MNTFLRYSWGPLLTLVLNISSAAAQPAPIKFGKPNPADFVAVSFAADSAAAAVVLCDYGNARVVASTVGLQVELEQVCRIKILKKSGFDHASIIVPMFGSNTTLVGLKGFTYNMVDGAVVKSKLESDGKYTDDVTTRLRVRKFTMPNVQVGSVIEYSYTLVAENRIGIPSWNFQRSIPVRWSEYRVSYPLVFDYRMVLQGYVPLAVREQTEGSTQFGTQPVGVYNYRWAMKNVPAFATEPFITMADDYLARIEFELASVQSLPGMPIRANSVNSWTEVDNSLMESEDFGRQLDRGGFLQAALAKVPTAAQAPLAVRVAAVHALVREAVKFTDYNSLFTSASLRKTYQEVHRGNAADINLLLIAALRELHIEANPVVLSTRDHGHLNAALPLVARFNYVVAHVALTDGQELLLDATDPLLPAGMLPERCLNQTGRLVMKSSFGSRWLAISPSQRRVHYQQVQLTLTPQGGLSGKVHEEHSGYAAAAVRAEIVKQGEAQYRSQFVGQHSGWTVSKFALAAREELAKPLAVDYEFVQPAEAAQAAASTFYFSPLDEFSAADNPFRSEARVFPVDFGTAREETTRLSLTLPEGYELAEVPKAAIIELPDDGGRYQYTVSASGNSVQLLSRLSLRKPVYAANEYVHLREFYRLMLEKQAEKLVVRKKV